MNQNDHGADIHFELAARLAVEGLKALLIFNGGAAVALIALAGSITKVNGTNAAMAHSFLWPIIAFGTGAFLTVVTMAIGYFSQLSYANHRFGISQEDGSTSKTQYSRHKLFQRLAIVTVGLVLAFGFAGIITAWRAVASS